MPGMTKPPIDPSRTFGRVGLWTGVLDAHPTSAAQRAAQLVEELGFPTLWIPEAVGRDPFVAAATLLGATTKLNIATGIANIYARDPMTMASCQKTLCEAYDGRFLLGMGVSHGHLVAGIRKHDWSKPLSYMREYLARMDSDKALFMAVGPSEPPMRVIAALGPKMLELAAAETNGSHPYFTTPDHTKMARDVMGPGSLLMPEQMVVLETDPEKARATARRGMKVYLGLPNYFNNLRRIGFTEADWENGGSDRLVDAIVAWGTIDQIAARVRDHHDAGADHVCVQVLRNDTAVPEQEWREIATAML
jgi:probable F420-dependent oxidoreductase